MKVKKIIRTACVAITAIVTLALTGCKKEVWLTDFDAAKKQAQKQDKNIFLVFSGDDWDQTSEAFKKSVTETTEFAEKMSKDYVFVNIDFSQTEYAKTDIDESASKKQKKEAEKIVAMYEKKENLAKVYAIQQYPSLYITTYEGYVLANVSSLSSASGVEEFFEGLEEYKESISEASYAIHLVRSSTGSERASAISELYNSTPSEFLGPLVDLVREVPSLDPQNETGVVGDMLLFAAYFDSAELVRDDVNAASKCFEDITASEFLTDDQKQNAYYMAAYVLTFTEEPDYEKIEEFLQKAYDIDPEGEHAEDLMNALEATRSMASQMAE